MDFLRAFTPLWVSLNDEHCNALSMNMATLEAKNILFLLEASHQTQHAKTEFSK